MHCWVCSNHCGASALFGVKQSVQVSVLLNAFFLAKWGRVGWLYRLRCIHDVVHVWTTYISSPCSICVCMAPPSVYEWESQLGCLAICPCVGTWSTTVDQTLLLLWTCWWCLTVWLCWTYLGRAWATWSVHIWPHNWGLQCPVRAICTWTCRESIHNNF